VQGGFLIDDKSSDAPTASGRVYRSAAHNLTTISIGRSHVARAKKSFVGDPRNLAGRRDLIIPRDLSARTRVRACVKRLHRS
jgi:hypothetical protein